MKTMSHARAAFDRIVKETKLAHLTHGQPVEEAASTTCADAPISRLMLALLYATVNDDHEWQNERCPNGMTSIGEAMAEELADYVAMVVEGDLEQ